MDGKSLNKIVEKLAGKGALACHLHADGGLVIIDAQGKKVNFCRKDYQHILPGTAESKKGATNVKPG